MKTITERMSVGIAGWSYPDWDGFVYPKGTRDKLAYASQFVDMVGAISTTPAPRPGSSRQGDLLL